MMSWDLILEINFQMGMCSSEYVIGKMKNWQTSSRDIAKKVTVKSD